MRCIACFLLLFFWVLTASRPLPALGVEEYLVPLGSGDAAISWEKDAQDGGAGLAAFDWDRDGRLLLLDGRRGVALVREADGKFRRVPLTADRRYVDMVARPGKDGGFLTLASPPCLEEWDAKGKRLRETRLERLQGVSGLCTTARGLTLVHDATRRVVALYRDGELTAALGGDFPANLALTADSRIPQCGEVRDSKVDVLLIDPYQLRPAEIYGRVAPFFRGGEWLGSGVLGVDAADRILVWTLELHEGRRYFHFNRLEGEKGSTARLLVEEEARVPADASRSFTLAPDGSILTWAAGRRENELRILRYRLDEGTKNVEKR